MEQINNETPIDSASPLTLKQAAVLRTVIKLRGDEVVPTQAAVADALGVPKGTVASSFRALERRGYIRRSGRGGPEVLRSCDA